MKQAFVDPERCLLCATCPPEEECLRKALVRENRDEMPWVDAYRCLGCMKCKAACPHRAIIG